MLASPPWRDIAGTLSCFVKITISVDINPLFENQVWARGLGQGHGKKRHLHAHSPVNFKELKCYEFFMVLAFCLSYGIVKCWNMGVGMLRLFIISRR